MTDSVGRPQEGQYRVLCGTCPDTQCQTRLFFPAHNSSIECTGCGQRHERDAIKQVSPDPTPLRTAPRAQIPTLSQQSPLCSRFPAHNSSIECTGCGQRHERTAIKQVSPDPTALDPGPRSPSLSRHSPLYRGFLAHNSSIECTGCGQRHERDAIKQVSPDPTLLRTGPRAQTPTLSQQSPLWSHFPAHNSSIECTGCGQRHERTAIKQVNLHPPQASNQTPLIPQTPPPRPSSLGNSRRARNYRISRFLGHPKMVMETEILEQAFPLENQGFPGRWTTFKDTC